MTEIAPQQFRKEVILWNSLSHPNVLKLIGILCDIERYQLAMVSGWMAHGNIMEYITENATDRSELVRVSTLRGECFVHSSLATVASCGARTEVPPRREACPWGSQRGSCLVTTWCVCRCLILQWANILMTNDTPPKACLADFYDHGA